MLMRLKRAQVSVFDCHAHCDYLRSQDALDAQSALTRVVYVILGGNVALKIEPRPFWKRRI